MSELKYKAGDKVQIKDIDWYYDNRNRIDEVTCGNTNFIPDMVKYCGGIVTISAVLPTFKVYHIKEDGGMFNWTDEMIDCLVERNGKTYPYKIGDRVILKGNNRCATITDLKYNSFGNLSYYIKIDNDKDISTDCPTELLLPYDNTTEGLVEEEAKPEPKFKVGDKIRLKSTLLNDIFGVIGYESEGYRITNISNGLTYFMSYSIEHYYELVEEETKFGTASNPIEPKSNTIREPKFYIGDKVILDPYPCIVTNVQWKDGYGFVYTVGGTDFSMKVKEDDLVFDERPTPTTDEIVKNIKADWDNFKNRYNLPDGYHFVDKNGNEINISEIVFEKKKPKYPTTYEECCTILGFHYDHYLTYDDEKNLPVSQDESDFIDSVDAFAKLIICRNAYWKLYGEEMGLETPWTPDWECPFPSKYIISYHAGVIIKAEYCGQYNKLLSFPTEEMRDAFKKNFDPDIEFCKEFL